jgi:phosphoribosylformylglycinamidine cyclo-ligase
LPEIIFTIFRTFSHSGGKTPLALTYAQSGVDIDAGNRFIRRIKKAVRSTFSREVIGDIGAFGGFFDARFREYKSPVLVSSVDGVGTKLLVAQSIGKHDTVGEDLVNHCVNDILVCGAKPLYFLDYFATGRVEPGIADQVIAGFVRGCKRNGCALIGGETAEMPGMYGANEYDLSGTIVGVVEKKDILDGRKVKKGDVLVGLPSTGLHTNGYSLARAVLFPRFSPADRVDELDDTVGNTLLRVHRSYLRVVTALRQRFPVHALAHITGGGILGNTMRVLRGGLRLHVHWDAWKRPPIFELIQRTGDVPEEDMRQTFNLGIGLVMIVPRKRASEMVVFLRRKKQPAFEIGEVV